MNNLDFYISKIRFVEMDNLDLFISKIGFFKMNNLDLFISKIGFFEMHNFLKKTKKMFVKKNVFEQKKF